MMRLEFPTLENVHCKDKIQYYFMIVKRLNDVDLNLRLTYICPHFVLIKTSIIEFFILIVKN